ncbi:MAG: cytochrome c biogenesis protein CcsA [Prevotella sp.]|nr:cytochrome c biogenesis protein CcsA [Prevotella sp.]
MSWEQFVYFAVSALVLWAIGAFSAWKGKAMTAYFSTFAGLVVFLCFIVSMWISLERPPLRTMGETRLWYAFFLPLAGLMVYSRWKYCWILAFSTILATVFVGINLLKPEIHSKTLMPALQSPWFAPHVIVYMFAYALLGAAFLMSIYLLFTTSPWLGRISEGKTARRQGKAAEAALAESGKQPSVSETSMSHVDNLVYVGLAFMTVGMLFGALWAKEAWGHYWSWDPKETWAAVTWLAYLTYIHYRLQPRHRQQTALWLLVIAFVLLQMCWWGINYLPSAQGSSIHTYGGGCPPFPSSDLQKLSASVPFRLHNGHRRRTNS